LAVEEAVLSIFLVVLWPSFTLTQFHVDCTFQVLEKVTVEEQIEEMREYFKAFAEQNKRHRELIVSTLCVSILVVST